MCINRKERVMKIGNHSLIITIVIILNGCAALTPHTGWDAVLADMNNIQQQYAQQSTKQQNTQSQVKQSQTGYVQPKQQTNNSSLTRESDAKKIENEGASLARQTSDYSKSQAIQLTASSLANKIRNGEITLAQAQAQLKGSQTQQGGNQTQQGIQVAGWYYTNPQYSNSTKTTISLTVQRRETGGVYPQYLILSAEGQRQSSVIASYDRNTGLYVFSLGSRTVHFNM